MISVIGWTDAYTSPYEEVKFTTERKQALFECVKKRHYDFTYDSMCFLPYGAPFFSDGKMCIPTRQEWEELLKKVYSDSPRFHRLSPLDAIKDEPVQNILFENENVKKDFLESKRV